MSEYYVKSERKFTFHSVAAAIAYGNAVKSGTVKCLKAENGRYAEMRVGSTNGRTDSRDWCEGLTDDAAYGAILAPTVAKREAMDRFGSAIAAFEAPMAPAPRRRLVKRLDDGDSIDAVRYATEFTVEGVWSKRVRSSRPRPAIRVAMNACCHCGTHSDEMARAAAATLSLVRTAEDCGYAVEVDWCLAFGVKNRHVAVVPLKRMSESLDWDTLVGFTVGASTFRTLGFDMIPGLCDEDIGYGWGRVHDATAADGGYDIVGRASFGDEEDAKRWLADALDKVTNAAAAAA